MVFSKISSKITSNFLLHFLIYIDVLMLCKKFEVIPTSIFQVMSIIKSHFLSITTDTPQYVAVFYQSWKELCACSKSSLSILQSSLKTLLMTSEDQLSSLTRLILMSILLVSVEGVCPPSSDLYEEFVEFLKNCFWNSDKEVTYCILHILLSFLSYNFVHFSLSLSHIFIFAIVYFLIIFLDSIESFKSVQ